MHVTNRPIKGYVFGVDVIIPEGTEVTNVTQGGWAIKDVGLIERLTGNIYDSKYSFVWVSEQCVSHKESA
jgi:hypothetical protein